ncbi:MAG TPA: hypothetical protein EYO59_06285 [Chromatiaceae bacterium]|nr:hypothetical protein [Chromatiaceae bacterium]
MAGKASEGLREVGIKSETLDAHEYAWENGKNSLGKKDILIIDEAGMPDERQLQRVVQKAKEKGTKIVLVGDKEQFQAIEFLSAFRGLSERLGSVNLAEIEKYRKYRRNIGKKYRDTHVSPWFRRTPDKEVHRKSCAWFRLSGIHPASAAQAATLCQEPRESEAAFSPARRAKSFWREALAIRQALDAMGNVGTPMFTKSTKRNVGVPLNPPVKSQA